MEKFPGPWKKVSTELFTTIEDANGELLADVANEVGDLVIAAPDLYVALRDLEAWHREDDPSSFSFVKLHEIRERARAALKKVEEGNED